MTKTLLDEFAMAAMVAMYFSYHGNPPEPEQIADEAYGVADAMLAEKDKREKVTP